MKPKTPVFLERREQLSSSFAMELNQFKKKMTKLMAGEDEVAEDQVKLMMMEYFQSSHAQLKCQKSIYEKETELGGMFSEYSEEFIKEHFLQMKPKAGKSTVEAVKKAYNILRSSVIDMEEVDATKKITSKDQLKKLAGGLNKLNTQLNTKRDHLQTIQKMMAYLEDVVDFIKADLITKKEKPKPKKKSSKKDGEDAGQRMAFMSRAKNALFGIGGKK